MSSPSLSRLIPTSTSNLPSRRSLIISIRSIVLTSECRYLTLTPIPSKYSVRRSAIFLVRVVTRTLSFFSTRFCISAYRSSTCPFIGRTSILGSNSPVGLMTCSTIRALQFRSSSPGVAETNTAWFSFAQNSSKLSGLLSKADGSLNPYLTRFSFLALSPAYIALTWGSVTCDSSTNIRKSLGK